MPSAVKILSDSLINKIAAGEVVERPASVVKELIENSLDADASEIIVEIEQAGTRLIRITDNGSGMTAQDAKLAFERHATSKISSESDLEGVRTFGFRGEALSSIAAVSQIRMLTALRGSVSGTLVEIAGGKIKSATDAAASFGTMIEVRSLFFNTPARLKFLKSTDTEFSHIVSAVSHQAMSHPSVRFRLLHNKKNILDLPPAHSLRERAFQIFGENFLNDLLDFSGHRDPVRVYGLIGKPHANRADRGFQEFYVNSRFVRNASLSHALSDAYRDLIPHGRHAVGFIFVDIDPMLVDVNVHPAKTEVRFRNQAQIHDLVREIIRGALRGGDAHGRVSSADRVKDAIADYLQNPKKEVELFYSEEKAASADMRGVQLSENLPFYSSAGLSNQDALYPVAQIHNSFIVAQSNDGMSLIDQHAAHERVLFEKLQDQYAAGAIQIQALLIPVQVELSPAESAILEGYSSTLHEAGFIVENFGGGTAVIKAVPAVIVGADYKQLLLDILDEIKSHDKSGRIEEVRDEIFSVMACHPAIKINRKLSLPEMERLISDLFGCRMPHSCPHGRPTVVRFTIDEIKKMFKRT